MPKFVIALAVLSAACAESGPRHPDLARWEQHASNVTITRDDWGIPHIHGKTDADAVFGMIYAQAEDDFNRVETNFLTSIGRRAEAEGDSLVMQDLRMKLFINPDTMKTLYAKSPGWLKGLMDAWADGLNYYLHTHTDVKPRVLTRFEPWMALTFSEGSIGGDIESVNLRQLGEFYAPAQEVPASKAGDAAEDPEPRGSNGIAIAPANTTGGHALLLINPHTSFFFRAELQVTSDEGLNAYGAVTWGQFFVYQGFNSKTGWMHTSSGVDNIDEYLETVAPKGDGYVYKYGGGERPVDSQTITVPYKTSSGMATKVFTVYRTHHGPIVRKAGDKWVSVKLMNDPLNALTQSFSRTKTTDYPSFRATMDLRTNSSNNTLFASAGGDIAYLHANFVPKRDTRFDWNNPVDGSDPATEWNGLHTFDESPNVVNPPNGWVYNSNNWPFSAAGPNSPKQKDFPRYMETGGENQRGVHAIRVLENRKDFTLDGLIAAAYDSYQPAFAATVPALLKAYDHLPAGALKASVSEQIALLRNWDYRWSASSIETSIAIAWAEEIMRDARAAKKSGDLVTFVGTQTKHVSHVEALAAASKSLEARFGTWKTPWGDINRFQRLTDDIVHPFDDAKPSIPVAFSSANWGSLASFGARTYKGSKKLYGTSGNSFVAVVEFGDSVRAKAVTAGGQSGNPASPHFNDQALRYSTGDLRDVYFYPSQLKGHTERVYRPGK